MGYVKVAHVTEVPSGTGKQIVVGKKTLALFHVEGQWFALDNACPHRGASLWDGPLDGTEVICPLHGARFDLKTGAQLCPPAKNGVRCYPVQLVQDEVQVDIA